MRVYDWLREGTHSQKEQKSIYANPLFGYTTELYSTYILRIMYEYTKNYSISIFISSYFLLSQLYFIYSVCFITTKL